MHTDKQNNWLALNVLLGEILIAEKVSRIQYNVFLVVECVYVLCVWVVGLHVSFFMRAKRQRVFGVALKTNPQRKRNFAVFRLTPKIRDSKGSQKWKTKTPKEKSGMTTTIRSTGPFEKKAWRCVGYSLCKNGGDNSQLRKKSNVMDRPRTLVRRLVRAPAD